MHRNRSTFALWGLLSLCLSDPVAAQHALQQTEPDTELLSSKAFLEGHPDLRYQKWAERAYLRGRYTDAIRLYKLSAYYADKHSQARVAEILWVGEGEPRDRALAYVWMDMAAERGYRTFLARRERFWSEMDQAERDRALSEGPALYEKYGDEAAKPRLEHVLFAGKKRAIGSHTGFVRGGDVYSPADYASAGIGGGGGGPIAGIAGAMKDGQSFKADRFYDVAYWEPELYWQWQARLHDMIDGQVEVGDLRTERESPHK